jgi:outer membrane protein OmpA-like peptidoglycan-associated protein
VIRAGSALASAALLAALQGCAAIEFIAPPKPETVVVVVPGEAGHVGAVVVNPGPEQQVLDTAYASAQAKKGRKPKIRTVKAEEVEPIFTAARQAAPLVPVTFTAHFILGTDLLTADSKMTMDEVMAEVGRRPNADILVIGHTDGLGPESYNEALSLSRAESVRDYMVERGFRAEIIRTAGYGEREPLPGTEDGQLSNPQNRRVEITVR